MNLELILFLIAGASAAGFVNGLAGFGVALFALGWWLQVLTPLEAVAVALIVSITSGIQGLIHIWHNIKWKALLVLLIPSFFGVPIGYEFLKYVSPFYLKLLIAFFLISYGIFFIWRSELPKFEKKTPVIDGFIGFCGGILASFAGLSGVLPTMWYSLRPWPKAEIRGVLQSFNMIILSVTTAVLALNGAYTPEVFSYLAIAVPVSFISAFVGIQVFKRLKDLQFRRLLIILMFLSGGVLFLRTIL